MANPEIRQKVSNAKKGKKLSEEHKRKISESMKRKLLKKENAMPCGRGKKEKVNNFS